jgi:Fur family ferric uptake transcriptional regulator
MTLARTSLAGARSGEVTAIHAPGRRLTRQRALIWEALVENEGGHLSAADVTLAVRANAPDLHHATIYRTLDRLVQDGLLRRTDLGAGRSYYELAAEHRHHHVVCASCGAVAHLHEEIVETMFARVEAASGYTLTGTELTFQGRCPACEAPS